jgi:hypothetical protein
MEDKLKPLAGLGLLVLALVIFWVIFNPYPRNNPNVGNPGGDSGDSGVGIVDIPVSEQYTNADLGFSAFVPPDYSIQPSYFYYALGPGREIPGVKFTIPASLVAGTNLSADSGVSVELLSRAACIPDDFLDNPSAPTAVMLGGNQYASATAGGAGAGNLYEETIFVRKVRDACYGIRYFIHSTQVGNYPIGTVRGFDRAALLQDFQAIASSVSFI